MMRVINQRYDESLGLLNRKNRSHVWCLESLICGVAKEKGDTGTSTDGKNLEEDNDKPCHLFRENISGQLMTHTTPSQTYEMGCAPVFQYPMCLKTY
jgi:hypothetical protein